MHDCREPLGRTAISSVSFDWHSSAAAPTIEVSTFGAGNSLLSSISDPWDSIYIVDGWSPLPCPGVSPEYRAERFSLDLRGVDIYRQFTEDARVDSHHLEIDNLSFSQVPEPSTSLLLGIRSAGLTPRRRTHAPSFETALCWGL